MGTAAFSLWETTPLAALALTENFSGRRLVTGTGEAVAITDLDTLKIARIPIDFVPHNFVRNPRYPERVWAIKKKLYSQKFYDSPGKRGSSAVEVDMRTNTVLQKLYLPEGSEFFGHGFFSPDAGVLFVARIDLGNHTTTGYLTGYDAADCRKVVVDYKIAKGPVHDCRLMPDKTAMAACSGVTQKNRRVQKGRIVKFDIAAGRVIKEWFIDDDKHMAGHFSALDDGTLIAISNRRPKVESPGKVYIGTREDTALKEIPYSDIVGPRQPGECLSIAVNEAQHIAVVTNPENARLLVIDLKRRAFIREIQHFSFGVAFDAKAQRFISSGKDLFLLDAEGNAVLDKTSARVNTLSGPFNSSHSLLI
jgi:hypothetical protein